MPRSVWRAETNQVKSVHHSATDREGSGVNIISLTIGLESRNRSVQTDWYEEIAREQSERDGLIFWRQIVLKPLNKKKYKRLVCNHSIVRRSIVCISAGN